MSGSQRIVTTVTDGGDVIWVMIAAEMEKSGWIQDVDRQRLTRFAE